MPKYDPRFWEVPFDPEVLEALPDEARTHTGDEVLEKAQLRADAVQQLRVLINTRLTERQRLIVELYFFEGLTQDEIARRLGITQQVVSKHLFGVIRKGKRVGGALAKLRSAASDLGIDPSRWV